MRIYYEAIRHPVFNRERTELHIPYVRLGFSYFPRELTIVPKSWGRTLGPVVFESVNERGGHFAAWEKPEVIVRDLRTMFGKGGGAFGVVKCKEGYIRRESKL